MGILLFIIFGLIVGIVAKWIVPGEGPGGILGDIIVGIIGAFIGGFIYSIFGHVGVTGFNLWSFICAIIGAIVLLYILRMITGRRTAV
ncbi:MAG: GlsB/YeaQ/YmgE family stress response membrane protein [Vulcanimicrobiaceae bacterium]